MKQLQRLIIAALWLMGLPVVCPADEQFHSGLSLQGYTGILNTPSAYVSQEGFISGLYSDQKETMWRDKTSYQHNYLFSVGVFDFAELGGRLTEAPGVPARDLSANVKLTTEPLVRNHPYAPVLAAGYQDAGGGAKFFQNRYVVVSEELWRLRLSAGYGFGPQRMKGMFAGGEFKAHDWFYLLGEHDTRDTNLGARIVTPQFWNNPVRFTATVKTSLNHQPGNVDIGFGFTFPLDFQVRTAPTREAPAAANAVSRTAPDSASHIPAEPLPTIEASEAGRLTDNQATVTVSQSPLPPATPPASTETARLTALQKRLVKAGFRNVRVGSREGETVVIEYENVVFNHNEMDALGVVSGMAAAACSADYRLLTVIIKKKDLRMLQVSMPLKELADFVVQGRNPSGLAERMSVSNRCDDDPSVTFVESDGNSSVLTTSLVLWPGLTTFVGTERGVFDYLLSIKPELFVNLWKGGVINARWDLPLAWSDNLDNGQPFRGSRTPAQMDRLMLFQGVKLLPEVMVNLGAGMVSPEVNGTLNELAWIPGTGNHAVRLVQSWGRSDNNSTTTETYLASYRYYFAAADLFLTGTAGKFMAQDHGFALEMKRMFADTGFAVYYKNSTGADKHHWQAAGVTFSFPLTPARDMKPYYGMQLRGTDDWSYSQETVLTTGTQKTNDVLNFQLAATPQPTASLYNQYLNRDRLSEAYIMAHLPRLHSAWLRFGTSM